MNVKTVMLICRSITVLKPSVGMRNKDVITAGTVKMRNTAISLLTNLSVSSSLSLLLLLEAMFWCSGISVFLKRVELSKAAAQYSNQYRVMLSVCRLKACLF